MGSVDNISSMEFKRYDSSTYQAARDASVWGKADPSLEDTWSTESLRSHATKGHYLRCGSGIHDCGYLPVGGFDSAGSPIPAFGHAAPVFKPQLRAFPAGNLQRARSMQARAALLTFGSRTITSIPRLPA